jgi:hypothetical protein
MQIKVTKVEELASLGYGDSSNEALGYTVFFTMYRNGCRYNCSTYFLHANKNVFEDYSFTTWAIKIYDLLSSDTL